MELWTPLFSGIVGASIWEAPYHVRIVWIAILALKDKKGFVGCSVPGLARLANVTREECEEALARFEGPDKDSKCQDSKGVKLVKVDGGWRVMGHERNLTKMHEISEELRRIKNAERQAKWRARQAAKNGHSNPSDILAGQALVQAAKDRGDSPEEIARLEDSIEREIHENKKVA